MKKYRTVLSALAALALVPVMAISAQAAAPSNDTVAGATVVTGPLPQTLTENTTEATTDLQDAQLNEFCGAPYTNASVWFAYTADDGGPGFVVTMENSDYSGGFLVFEGSPTPEGLVGCGPTTVAVYTQPGSTYYVMAISDTPVNGGDLEVTFSPAPPSPQISLQVNPTGQAFKDGSAVLRGTYSCTNAYDGGIDGTLTQRVGRIKITGYFSFYPVVCDGTSQPWEAIVVSDNGLFAGGKSASVTYAYACGDFECASGYAEQSVKLNRARTH